MFSRLALLAASTLAIVMIGAAPVRPAFESPVHHALLGRFSERNRITPILGDAQATTSTAIIQVLHRNNAIYVDWQILRKPLNIVFCGIEHARFDADGQLTWRSIDGWGNHGIGTLIRRGDGYWLSFRLDGHPVHVSDGIADFYQTYRLERSELQALNK